MRIGILSNSLNIPTGLADLVRQVADAELEGFESFWLPQGFGADVLTVISLAAQKTERIELGTAVVPTLPHHPMVLAQQALTVQEATGGRFTLGVGFSHKSSMEDGLGLSYDQPARHMKEYLSVLRSLVDYGCVDFDGAVYRVCGNLQQPDARPFPILLGALGPMMLRIAGELADGTITWMCGRRTIETHIVPRIDAVAEQAGRPKPRVCVGVPVAVTDEPERARRRAASLFQHYAHMPNYRRMLDIEGVEGPAEIIIAGDEAQVEKQLRDLANAGATDLLAMILPVGGLAASPERTRALLLSLIGKI
ncbi:MAG: LLM class F420-dependent oxidoreductase [Chloroflexi bacterium]|nr:LLM class F420-dependent oxidoreductase [Chloroflexota bacterium]